MARPNLTTLTRLGAAACLGLTLAACALSPSQPEAAPADLAPAAWNVQLPHAGNTATLERWWQDLGDPVLVDLIEAAQRVSPTVASATSRRAQARAALGSAEAANRPSLTGSLSAQRGVNASSPVAGTALTSSLDASWEIDLFGANRNAADAAQARLEGSGAEWHEARVSVAAETANLVFTWRSCQQQLALAQADATSRQETARLSDLSAQAGFTAPAVAVLARASAAESRSRLTLQRNQCDTSIKALVALTALPESALRARLEASAGHAVVESGSPLPMALPAVASVPAQVLSQRPDLYAAQRAVAAASAELGSAEAQRYPRLMLNGQVGTLNYSSQGNTTDLSTWSVGPITLSLPLLDGGRRAANVQAAQARYEEAAALYRAKARQAVLEVEESLLNLAALDAQKVDAGTAASGYAASLEATRARYQAGSASLPELEDARRTTLAAQTTLLQLDLQRSQAWVALYRALGGGWNINAAGTP
jgi:NodT family efflux transporter outer membrane factor (OMF) lipoprotein